MRIVVTQRDIIHGQTGDCYKCPIARAITRRIKDDYYIAATPPFIRFYRVRVASIQAQLDTPTKVATFIRKFDDGQEIKPFHFQLDIPQEYVK